MSVDRLSVSASPASSRPDDPRSVGGFLDALRNQGAAPPTKVATWERYGYQLDPLERWMSPEYQDKRLRQMGFRPAGTFEMRLDPRAYGIPMAEMLEMLDRFRAFVRISEFGPEVLELMFILPLQAQGRVAAGTLVEENRDLPPEWKQAARENRLYTETVFEDVVHRTDRNGRYVAIRGKVYVKPYGWSDR